MSSGFIKKLEPPHEFPFVTNPRAVMGRPIPFSELSAPENFSFPISNSVSLLRRFTPKSIKNGSTLLLWLDFGDKTSFDISNSIVRAIRDKGKDSKAITILGTFSISSQNNLPVIKLDDSVPGVLAGEIEVSNFNMRRTFTSFIVCKSPNTTWDQILWEDEASTLMSITMRNYIYFGSPTIAIQDKNSPFRRSGANGTTIIPYNIYIIYVIGRTINTGPLSTYRINGVSYDTIARVSGINYDSIPKQYTNNLEDLSYSTGTFSLNHFWMSTGVPSSPTIDGTQPTIETAEYMMYDEYLSFSDVEKIEGYLAAKWGLQSSLPETHSFKRVPPTMI